MVVNDNSTQSINAVLLSMQKEIEELKKEIKKLKEQKK